MAVWWVRAEKQLERCQIALENNIALPRRNKFPGTLKAHFPLKRFWARGLKV
jgi:hypothetical protein